MVRTQKKLGVLIQCAFGASLAYLGGHCLDSLAADVMGWQHRGFNVYFESPGGVAIGEGINSSDDPGKLVIGTSGTSTTSIHLKYTENTSESISIKPADLEGWEIHTKNHPKLRMVSNPAPKISILDGQSSIAEFTNEITLVTGSLSATEIRGDGAGLRYIDASQITNATQNISVHFIKTADSAGRLMNARTIRLTGDVSATAPFNGLSDVTLNASFNQLATPTFSGLGANNIAADNGVFSGKVESKTLWLTTGGSASSPVVAFTSSTGTGIFRPEGEVNVLAIATSSTERLRITADGKVGIGKKLVSAELDVAGTGRVVGTLSANALSATSATFNGDVRAQSFVPTGESVPNTGMLLFDTSGIAFSTNTTPRVFITSSGNIGIGNSTPETKLKVSGNATVTGTVSATSFTGDGSDITNIPATSVSLLDGRNIGLGFLDREKLLIYNPGTGPSPKGRFSSFGCYASNYIVEDNYERKCLTGAEIYTLNGTPSDIRLKYDIQPINDALDTIKRLNGVTYFWNRQAFPERNFSDKLQTGFIAQEIEKILPHLVETGRDGYKSLDYIGFIAINHEGIKSLNTQHKDHSKRLAVIEEKIKISDEWISKSDLRFKAIESIISTDQKIPETGIFIPNPGALGFSTGGSHRMIIDASGNVGIGTANPSSKLDLRGDAVIAGRVYQQQGAYVLADKENKIDLQPVNDALLKLNRLTGYSFKWKENNQPGLGVSAQEVQSVFPELVRPVPAPHDAQPRLAVNYNGLVAPLVESVKNLKTDNQNLQKKNTAVEKALADQAAENEKRIIELEKTLAERRERVKNIILQQQIQAALAARQAQIQINDKPKHR